MSGAPGVSSVGIDGCRGGWIAVALTADGGARWLLAARVAAILERWPNARYLIDIPIGLPDGEPREVEGIARRLLGHPRGTSVFPVPCRAAVYAPDYAEACRRNRAALGCAVSRQAWNLVPKIREVDALLGEEPVLAGHLLEAHPELCFRGLAGGTAMAAAKKTPEGFAERLSVLAGHLDSAPAFVHEVLARTRRSAVARDDLLDALALAVSGRLPLSVIPPGRPLPGDAGGTGTGAAGPGNAFPRSGRHASMVFPAGGSARRFAARPIES